MKLKTIEEKASLLVESAEFYKVDFGDFKEETKKALIKLLKEQDRDTRHKCAEAVLSCNEDMSGECIWKSDAHNACMNATAV
jgi:hypothetical protein